MEQQPHADCDQSSNPVVAENCLPGTADWERMNSSDIQIYASRDSVNIGQPLDFYVDTRSSFFTLRIFRMGYYRGLGARLVHTADNLKSIEQPHCVRYDDTGLRTCSNWSVSYSMTIPMDWISGVYTAQVTSDDGSASNQTVFTVRQDGRKSDMLYQMSITTFQAYNNFAGKSTYRNNSGTCDTVAISPRAVKVSLNRPYAASLWDPNYFFHTEYPMVRWLEQQGYDVVYSTNMDTHRSGAQGAHNALLDHKVFMSVGHDEYWSQPMRDAIEAARDAGVNIAFLGANIGYWRVRFEADPITNEPDSVMVTYKTDESGYPDPSGDSTGTWRYPEEAAAPENAIIGQMYIGYNTELFFPLRLSSEYTGDRLFRHTGLANMPPDTYFNIGTQIIGWEWDAPVENGMSPTQLQVLARTPVIGSLLLDDSGNQTNMDFRLAEASMTRYIAPSGAIVFAAGSIQWTHGLGIIGPDVIASDPYIVQITYNLFADMGVNPATPTDNLILDGSSTPDRSVPLEQLRFDHAKMTPVITQINATTNNHTIIVRWKTDVETIGQVWLGTDTNRINQYGGLDPIYSTDHALILPELPHGSTYFYKVAVTNRDWTPSIADAQSFITPTGSLGDSLEQTFRPHFQKAACWVQSNRTLTIIIGILIILTVTLLVARIVIVREKRILRDS